MRFINWALTNSFRNKAAHLFLCKLSLLLIFAFVYVSLTNAQQSNPELFSHAELVQFYEQPNQPEDLQRKLNTLLTTPFVSNAASERGIKPVKPRTAKLGQFLRIASWNIERGLEYEAILSSLNGPTSLASMLRQTKQTETEVRNEILNEAALLKDADVIVLNEVDWGMKRTDYRNIVADLATALNMNYAYGVEFVEIDPINLGIEKFEDIEADDRAELLKEIEVDSPKYKGLHGNAVLSRYRLENVRLVPLKFQPHDWYEDEKSVVAPVEKGKRILSAEVFRQKIHREVRRGGRMMLLAEIADPDIPKGRLTIVATHLEDRTKPKNREQQLEEILQEIRSIDHPVVIAGDMNTSGEDSTPTSLKREIKKRLGSKSFWLNRGISYATGLGLVKDVLIGGIKYTRTMSDPTVRNIPFVSPNPAAAFFKKLKKFRFDDGGAFDFRGDPNRSIGGSSETLGNSNERGNKGFITTYEVERKIGFVGKFKIDWIFVKPPDLTDPDEKGQSYRFAPHFGRTLKALNYSLEDRISDHSPIIADLPFSEPPMRGTKHRGHR